MRVKRVHLKTLLTLALILIPTLSLAWSDPEADGKPRNSYERQQETYRQHGYDTRQNGPLDETVAEERRKQERQREEERRQEESRSRYGNNSGYGKQRRSPD